MNVVEEGAGLDKIKAELIGLNFHQLAARPQFAQAEGWHLAAGHHQPQTGRCLFEDAVDDLVDLGTFGPVIVVQHHHQRQANLHHFIEQSGQDAAQ